LATGSMRMPAVRMPAGFRASPGGLAAASAGVAGAAARMAVAAVADPIVVANRKWRRSKQFSPAVVLFPPL
jgi:hypothetical protein